MCLKWDFFGIEWNCVTICKQLQIRIISENIFSLILMVYRHRKLGYPSLCLVADGQARMPVINGWTATPAEGRIIRGYTMGFDSPHLRISPGLSPQPTGTGREGRQGAADGRRRGRCPFLSLSSEFALQGSLTGQ